MHRNVEKDADFSSAIQKYTVHVSFIYMHFKIHNRTFYMYKWPRFYYNTTTINALIVCVRVCMANWWMNRWRMTVVKYIFQYILTYFASKKDTLTHKKYTKVVGFCRCNENFLLSCECQNILTNLIASRNPC